MSPSRSRVSLGNRAALTAVLICLGVGGSLPVTGWSAELDDPPMVGNLPLLSTLDPSIIPAPEPEPTATPVEPYRGPGRRVEVRRGASPSRLPSLPDGPATDLAAGDGPEEELALQQRSGPASSSAPAGPSPARPSSTPSAGPGPGTETGPAAGSTSSASPTTSGAPGGTAAAGSAAGAGAPGGTGSAEEFARIAAPNLAPGTGAGVGAGVLGFSDTPVMLGDQSPFSFRQVLGSTPPPTPTPGHPPTPGVPHPGQAHGAIFLPWLRAFKISENQSPRPQDRVFFTFNYFNNLNGPINQRINAPVSNLQVYREFFGFEKTFWNGNASIGLRVPVNTLTADSPVRGLGGTNTSFGNMTVFTKFILWQDKSGRNLVSTGVAVTGPNGPTAFAGAPGAVGFHDASIQKYVGYIFGGENWYLQGFEAIDVPTDSNDVTMLYNDLGVGYFVYKNKDPKAFISSIAPTFETHINIPLNHRGAFRYHDAAGTPDVVDLTYGINTFIRRRAMLTIGFVNPVTGPQPFTYEWQVLLNVYFGRTRTRAMQSSTNVTPPLGGS